MPDSEATRTAKTRQQIEDKLRAEIKLRLAQFKEALPGKDQAAAKHRYVVALFAFDEFVLYGRTPND
jgi:hypothetical protein